MSKNIFIGVAWPYVNGDIHIGHVAGYLLPCDICARYHRLIGNNVLMASGSDCFGTPITVEADKKGVSPEDIVSKYHPKDKKLFLDTLNLTYDIYTKTNHPNHIEVAQDLFVKMVEDGYIFVDSSMQYYSPEEKRFLPDRYVEGTCPFCDYNQARSDQCDNCGKLIDQGELKGAKSKLSGGSVELKETSHYFVDWKKLQPKIEKYFEGVGDIWRKWVRNEVKGWLSEGLKPRAITRDLDWGVPIPVDRLPKDKIVEGHEGKRIYVWFEAVIGYLSASKLWAKEKGDEDAWKDFWYGDNNYHYYFMGKDNLVFHTMFWPAQLMVYDEKLHLPDNVSINMFLNLGGKAFSKSRGITVDTAEFVEKYGNDALRFYLTLTMPEKRDTSFVLEEFAERVNGDLVGNLGNFIHRTLSLGKDLDVSLFEDVSVDEEMMDKIKEKWIQEYEALDKCQFRMALENILGLSDAGNSWINTNELWKLKDKDEKRFLEVMKGLYLTVLALAHMMVPILPHASKRLSEILGIDEVKSWPKEDEFAKVLKKVKVSNLKPLFNKIELEK